MSKSVSFGNNFYLGCCLLVNVMIRHSLTHTTLEYMKAMTGENHTAQHLLLVCAETLAAALFMLSAAFYRLCCMFNVDAGGDHNITETFLYSALIPLFTLKSPQAPTCFFLGLWWKQPRERDGHDYFHFAHSGRLTRSKEASSTSASQ